MCIVCVFQSSHRHAPVAAMGPSCEAYGLGDRHADSRSFRAYPARMLAGKLETCGCFFPVESGRLHTGSGLLPGAPCRPDLDALCVHQRCELRALRHAPRACRARLRTWCCPAEREHFADQPEVESCRDLNLGHSPCTSRRIGPRAFVVCRPDSGLRRGLLSPCTHDHN
jgi:hypothetical protein